MTPFAEIRSPKKRAFLAAVVETCGNIRQACRDVEIDISTPYTKQWRNDEVFQAALVEAKRMAADHLEAEAVKRATEGWQKGKPPSDLLMIFLLKGAMPEKYAERHRLGGDKDAPPIEIAPAEARAKLEERLDGVKLRLLEAVP